MSPARILAASWERIKELGAQWRAILWHAPWFVGAAVQLLGAGFQMAQGDYHHALTSAILGALLALWPINDRYSFRAAWERGFAEGFFAPGFLSRGTIPEPILRQMMTGQVAPEPWDNPTMRPRHASKEER